MVPFLLLENMADEAVNSPAPRSTSPWATSAKVLAAPRAPKLQPAADPIDLDDLGLVDFALLADVASCDLGLPHLAPPPAAVGDFVERPAAAPTDIADVARRAPSRDAPPAPRLRPAADPDALSLPPLALPPWRVGSGPCPPAPRLRPAADPSDLGPLDLAAPTSEDVALRGLHMLVLQLSPAALGDDDLAAVGNAGDLGRLAIDLAEGVRRAPSRCAPPAPRLRPAADPDARSLPSFALPPSGSEAAAVDGPVLVSPLAPRRRPAGDPSWAQQLPTLSLPPAASSEEEEEEEEEQEQRVSVPVEGRASNAEVGDHPEPCSGAPETSQEELFAAALVRRLEEVDPCAVPARPLLLACARAPMTSACSTRASTPRRAAMA